MRGERLREVVPDMESAGRHRLFDAAVRTHLLRERANKVRLADLVFPERVASLDLDVPPETGAAIADVARAILAQRREGRPVILFSGAHLIKNGLGPLAADLIKRGLITLFAGNGATAIHDFELALIGETSEHVPNGLAAGQFGMAYEFAYINVALSLGNAMRLGYGESLGRLICEPAFREQVLARAARAGAVREFRHPEASVLAACHARGIPFTVHAGIGTDVTDQHPSFDGEAKGGCSGRDFLVYAEEAARLTAGGVVLNVGSAVQGPEVLLKAVSMAANVGWAPRGILTADFDLREHRPDDVKDEGAPGYYWRDQKSVVSRIPEAFGGRGLYIGGNQKRTFPLLYRRLVEAG
jgi:hypothetical protein